MKDASPGGAWKSAPASEVKRRLDRRREEQTSEEAGSREAHAYRQAAAVLDRFDPFTLNPVEQSGSGKGDAAAFLMPHSTVVVASPDGILCQLDAGERALALAALGSRKAMRRALDANPKRPDTPLQAMLERVIAGELGDLDAMSASQLTTLLRVLGWVGGVLEDLPPATEVRRRLDVRSLRAPLEELVAQFRGRKDELSDLREYVGALAPETITSRAARPWLGLSESGPLVIHGLGGVGKSTLVAKFILEHVDATDEYRFPIAYLDFDDPRLVITNPTTLMREAVRQLELRFPEAREHALKVQDKLGKAHEKAVRLARRARHRAEREGTPLQVSSEEIRAKVQKIILKETRRFARFVQQRVMKHTRRGRHDPPLLLVFDTFEEVQFYSGHRLKEFWEWLSVLQQLIPTLRVVIAGRIQVTGARLGKHEGQHKHLSELDEEAARGFLEKFGVSRDRDAKAIIEKVGRNPLNLLLAARLARKLEEDNADAKDIQVPFLLRFFKSFLAEKIQHSLYSRLLEHIHSHDPDLKKLVHPGMALRLITPEIIREVLAGPCEIDVPDAARAKALFASLQQEVTLVDRDRAGVIRHRPDVRSGMLPSVVADSPDLVQAIRHRAVEYYAGQRGSAARAEEVYHRLCLGDELDVLQSRWSTGLEDHLRGAYGDLSNRGKVFFAARVPAIQIADDVLEGVALPFWEDFAERRTRALLEVGDAQGAYSVLAVREERSPNSPLHMSRALVQLAAGDWQELFVDSKLGLEEAEEAGDTVRRIRLLLLRAGAYERAEAYSEADDELRAALDLAQTISDPSLVLRVALGRLALRRHSAETTDPDDADPDGAQQLDPTATSDQVLDAVAVKAYLELDHTVFQRSKDLVREAAATLGRGRPDILLHALERVGMGQLDTATNSINGFAADYVPDRWPAIDEVLRHAQSGDIDFTGLPMAFAHTSHEGQFGSAMVEALHEAPQDPVLVMHVTGMLRETSSWNVYSEVDAGLVERESVG